jgi:hypothetical protein
MKRIEGVELKIFFFFNISFLLVVHLSSLILLFPLSQTLFIYKVYIYIFIYRNLQSYGKICYLSNKSIISFNILVVDNSKK